MSMPSDTASEFALRLTRRYVVALVAIAVTVAAAVALIEVSLLDLVRDGHEVNAARRQRTLSQRIAKNALVMGGGHGRVDALETDLKEWVAVHRALLDGDEARGLPGLAHSPARSALNPLTDDVERVRGAVEAVVEAAEAGTTAEADQAVAEVLASESAFLPAMDRVVAALDAESAADIRRLRWTALALLACLVGVLGAVGRFVLRPAVAGAAEAVRRAAERERLLRTVVDALPDHIYVKDTHGRAVLRNAASARALGFEDPEDGLGQTDAEVGSEAATLGALALADDLRVVRTGDPIRDREERTADGGWLLTTKVPLRDVDGVIVGIVGVSRDVTEARTTAAMYRGLVEHSVVGTAVIQDGAFVYVNPRMAAIFGYTVAEMTGGLGVLNVIHEGDRATVAENLRRRLDGEVDVVTYSVRGARKDGRPLYVELAGVAGEYGGRPAVIGTVNDVTERLVMEEALVHQAHHDDLTALPNRALFTSRLEDVIAREGPANAAVLFVDLDRFKVVNDTLGHSAGDRLLRSVASHLAGAVRPSDTVARFGGDEFAVLLDGVTSLGEAEGVARRVLEALRTPVDVGGRNVVPAASVGVVVVRADHDTPDAVLRDADLAMYDAKGAGRGGHAVYSPSAHGTANRRLRLEMDLAGAADRGELRVAYQPVVDLADGTLAGFEALVRWEHPELGLLYPDAFVGPAEESGHIVSVDRWVLQEACRQAAEWANRYGHGGALLVSVNCTGRDLTEQSYTDAVRAALDEHGLDPHRLLLEITETLLVRDPAAVRGAVEGLQAQGVRFGVDDFGTGYSSLAVLHDLPVDVIKVDRGFVGRMDADARGRELVRTVVALGSALGKSVVAEGVETPAHLAALRAMGCALGQGYLFSRPLGPEAAGSLVASGVLPWERRWDGSGRTAARDLRPDLSQESTEAVGEALDSGLIVRGRARR